MASLLSVLDLPALFSDLTPISQDDGPHSVCVIDYSEEFTEAYNYMRAVLKANEKSERALRLTGLCLKLNPANYTIWHFRRECLKALQDHCNDNASLTNDLDFAATLGGSNPKNYQIWYHRRALVELILANSNETKERIVEKELDYIAGVLNTDGKNYHAWSYRQWIVGTVDDDEVWKAEKEYAHSLILDDPRNNSAWNQRWFASHRGAKKPLDSQEVVKEADYALQGAELDPYNESPWRYLVAIIKEHANNTESKDTTSLVGNYEKKSEKLKEVLQDAGRDPNGCANLTSARIDLLEMKGDSVSLRTAADLAKGLATDHDVIREKYWLLREKELTQT